MNLNSLDIGGLFRTIDPAWKECLGIMIDSIGIARFEFDNTIVYENPEVSQEDRDQCLLGTWREQACDPEKCKQKRGNNSLHMWQLPVIAERHRLLLEELIAENKNNPDILKKLNIEHSFLYRWDEASDSYYYAGGDPPTYCEAKGDFGVLKKDSLFQLRPFNGPRYHLRGIYKGKGLLKCVAFSEEKKSGANPWDLTNLNMVCQPLDPKYGNPAQIVDAYVGYTSLICKDALVPVWGTKLKLFGESFTLDDSFLEIRNANLLKRVKLHKGIWNQCVELFNEPKFQTMLENALVRINSMGKSKSAQWVHSSVRLFGFSFGAACSTILSFLISVVFIPYYSRYIASSVSENPECELWIMGSPRVGNKPFSEYLAVQNVQVYNFVTTLVDPVTKRLYVDPVAGIPANEAIHVKYGDKPDDLYVNTSPCGILLGKRLDDPAPLLLDVDKSSKPTATGTPILNNFNYSRDCKYLKAFVIEKVLGGGKKYRRVAKFAGLPISIDDDANDTWDALHSIKQYASQLRMPEWQALDKETWEYEYEYEDEEEEVPLGNI